ncbi:hypothetical protein Tco_0040718 [Tanacetum coccineum]
MSDSEDSMVTYTAVSSPFGGLSDIGSLGVDGPPVMLEDPYAYVVAAFQAPPSPDYVPSPEEPKQAPPLPVYRSSPSVTLLPTADSPRYVPKFDPEKDLEEDDDEDPEEDPADYPIDRDDDDEEEAEEPSRDEADDEEEDKDDKEEEEEHLAPADFITVAFLAVDYVPSVEETEPFETDKSAATPPPHLAYRVTARISIRPQTPVSLPSDTEVARLLAIPTPPPSPLSPWLQSCDDPAETRGPINFPFTTATYHTLPHQSRYTTIRADRPKVTLPPQKRLGIALDLRYEVGYSLSTPTARPPRGFRADYGFVAIMNRDIMRDLERDVVYGITDTWDEMLDTDEIYTRLDDEQTERQLMAGRLNMLYRHRRAHARTTLLMEREAKMSREAWGRSLNASDLARIEVMSLRTTVLGQQAVIIELQAADHRR